MQITLYNKCLMYYNIVMNTYRVVLGSASPRRKELLREIVADYEVRTADVDERCLLPSPAQYVMYTAGKKSTAIAIASDELLITADTTVCFGREFLGKPHTDEEATAMLHALNGRVNVVYTGVCLRTLSSLCFFAEASEVRISMTESEIARYVAEGSAMDKAGAYGIQDENMRAELLSGTLSNVIGLPVEALAKRLARYGL